MRNGALWSMIYAQWMNAVKSASDHPLGLGPDLGELFDVFGDRANASETTGDQFERHE